jgi:lipid-A-disaccharide synthase
MEAAGMELRYNLAETSLLGFVEVLKSIGMIRRLFAETVAYFEEARPDVVVLIDYPGFNLRLAAKAHNLGIPVIYYIGPQVWAWRRGRVRVVKKNVSKMLVILPFEESIYTDADVPCAYVGHPLIDHLESASTSDRFAGDRVIGLLPGSRAQEIRHILPVMVDVAKGIHERYPDARFLVPCVDDERAQLIRSIAGDFPIEPAVSGMYDVLSAARFAMVAAGTATVETTLFKVPMAVVYRGSAISVWLARKLVGRRLNAIAIANILARRHIVPEFIQEDATADKILPHALELIDDSERRRTMIADYETVRGMLKGGASRAVAEEIIQAGRGAHAPVAG